MEPRPSRRAALRALLLFVPLLLAARIASVPQDERPGVADRIRERAHAALSEAIERANLPGASLAFVLPDGAEVTVVAGHSCRETEAAMKPTDRLPAGSTGKTFVAAAVLRAVHLGKLSLDDPAAKWLGEEVWFERLPNADDLTVRNLLNHTCGIPEYYSQREFIEVLAQDLERTWKPEELVAYVLDNEPHFPAGEGWSYADTNYLIVGMILERATDEAFYDQVRDHFLVPLELTRTIPTDRKDIPEVAQGYVVMGRSLGFPERAREDDRFTFNPQFEWCGGGFASTPLDLARWARILYTGKAFEGEYLDEMLDGVEMSRGPGPSRGRYGFGTILHETTAGPMHGHDGFFPGYLTSMGYFPEHGFAAAVQLNTDDMRALGHPSVHLLLQDFAAIAAEELAGR